MLQAIIRFSIKHKLMVMLLVLMLIIKGLFELSRLPLDALPDVTSNQVQVITVSPALAAPEVERLVTFTIEQYCSNIQGIVEMRSISRFGLSVVTLVFDDQTDVYWARQQVAERLGYIKDEIPIGAGMPFMAPLTTGLGEVYQYILKPAPGYEKIYSLAELRSIQDWIVRRQLIRLPGVADVSSFGGKLKQYEVSFRSDILNSMGLTVADVYEALQKNNQNSGGAYIEKNDQVLFIRTEGFIKNKEEIENIVIKQTQSSTPLLIKHVANVQLGHAIRYGALVNGSAGEVAGAVVLMLKGANAMEVVASLKKKIEEIKRTLPEGVVLEPFYDRSKMVNRSMNTVKTNLLEGALIVVFVLVLFLGNIRAGLIVASVIPLSMLFAVCMMNFFNVSGNLMSLGALDFGLIVDGAVIIVEAVMHRMRHMVQKNGNTKLTQETINKEVADTSHKIMNAAVFGQIIILIVYLPILALVGIEGKMFRPMAQTVSFALIGAFILSLTYVPMASALFIGNSIGTKETLSDKLMKLLDRLYTPALSSALRFPKTLIIGVVFILGIAFWMINTLGGEFIPELEEGDFAVDIRLPTGSSLTSSVQAATSASQLLESKFPEVEKIVCRVGASEIPTDPMPIEMGDLIILLKPKKEWTSAKTYDELANKMSETLLGIPGLSAGFQFPVQMRFNELISGARQDVVVKLFGEDLDTLAAYASKIGTVVQKVNGATDLYVESIIGLPQISIEYNRQAIANYGANIADLNQVIQTAFAGQEAGTIYENERRFALVMRLEAPQRTSVEDVRRLLIPTASGIQVPLYLLANVTVKEGPNQIQRENANRRIMVAFNVRNRDVESVVNELQDALSKNVKLPPGYFVHYGGAFENLKAGNNRLAIAVPLSLLLILVLLYFALHSVKYSLLVFSGIPLAAIGGVFGLYLRGLPFSISAGIGFIALFGVAVLNGIVLVSEFKRLQKEGNRTLEELVMMATRTRLRPVLMTAAVASLGFLPMALSQSAGAEVQRPLATVVIGGIMSATFLTLIVLPVLFIWMEKKAKSVSMVSPKMPLLLIAILLGFTSLHAQKSISLAEALRLLPLQNAEMKVAVLQQEYMLQLTETAGEMPRTRTMAELGQTNSKFFDSRISLSQSFLPFGVAGAQKNVFQTAVSAAEKNTILKQAELRMMVRNVFNEFLFQEAQWKHWQRIDSLYTALTKLAVQRLNAGETSKLETIRFQQQQTLARQQMELCLLQMTRQAIQLQVLLQSKEMLKPSGNFVSYSNPLAIEDSLLAQNHPLLQLKRQQAAIARAETQLQKTSRNPELEIGYNNQSLVGFQTARNGTEKFYEPWNRFSTAQIGMQFPIFGKASKAKIKAAASREKVVESEAKAEELILNGNVSWRLAEQKLLWHQIKEFENSILPQASTIYSTASQQLKAGELNFINWMVLAEPSLQIHLQYLEKILLYQHASSALLYLSEK